MCFDRQVKIKNSQTRKCDEEKEELIIIMFIGSRDVDHDEDDHCFFVYYL